MLARTSVTLLLLFILLLSVIACSGAGEATDPDDDRLHLVATTGQVADLARQLGGEHLRVTQIMGPGVDPHLYQPSESDIRTFEQAEVILYNGLRLEGRLGDVLRRMGERKPVVAVAEKLPGDALLADEEEPTEKDPHVWFDPRLWSQAIDVVAEVLAEQLPEARETLQANASAYREQIEQRYETLREKLAEVPEEQRVMITAHDAFQYFGRAFDIEVLGIQGMSTETEAGMRRIEELVELLVERRVPAVFVETSVNPRNVEALVEGAAARGHHVAIGGELYSDAMGAPGTPTGSYLDMLEHNVTTIAEALSKRS